MRLYPRIIFFLLITCFVPLGVLAASGLRATNNWLRRTIVTGQVEAAATVASTLGREIAETERLLQLQLGSFRLAETVTEGREAFLYATWRLSPDITIAVLRDAQGRDLVPPVYQAPGEPSLGTDHDAVDAAHVQAFLAALPTLAPGETVARGAPYRPEGATTAVLPVALASPWGDGIVLGVELRVSPLASATRAQRETVLLSREGAVLASSGEGSWVEPARFAALLGSSAAELRYETAGGDEVLAAMAAVPDYPIVAVVAEPASVVAESGRDIRARTLYIAGVSAVVALVMGTLLTRSITVPVLRLREAAVAVGAGELTRRVPPEGRDELAELAAAFNRMTDSLERNDREIAAKNREIEEWNRELVARVDRRTAQLRDAQARLVQSGQLAAVAELSAGLAHELNNPLAGLLGLLQIVIARKGDAPDTALLRMAEAEALRCKDIVANLLRFTEASAGEAVRGRVDLDAVVADVLSLMGGHLRARGVTGRHERAAAPLTVMGSPSALGRALGQLLTSLRGVGGAGAALVVSGATVGGEVVLTFALERTTPSQDDWRAAALGFWVARQVLQEHGATLEEPGADTAGGPAAWRLRMPAAGEAA